MSTTKEAHAPKSIFDDILSAPLVDPIEKYANLYSGINQNELASFDQSKAFIPYVEKLMKSAPTPIGFTTPTIVAIPSGMQTTRANVIPAEEILADGFPSDKKVHSFLLFEGPKKEEEDQFAGDDKLINVALAVRKYFGVPPGIPANPEGLLADIKG